MFSSIINRLGSSSWLWQPAPRKRTRRSRPGSETLEVRALLAVNLAGDWLIGTQATSITQSGSTLTFINERGETSSGVFINGETQVQATDWGNLVGTLVGTDRIEWANNTVWTRSTAAPTTPPDISGNYTINGRTATVIQNGSTLTFINEHGTQSSGTFLNNNTQVRATDWGNLVGTLTGNQIRWANGSVWTQTDNGGDPTFDPPDVAGDWSINGRASSVSQSGLNVVLTNENGLTANGVFINESQIRADGWGGLIGTLSADLNTINWANGSVWTRQVDVPQVPDLAGGWVYNGRQASITQDGNNLFFTNENGLTSTGRFLSATQIRADQWGVTAILSADGNTINWSTGAVWVRGDVDAPLDISGDYSVNNGSSLTARVVQDGTNLTFINERGQSSAGFFNAPDRVTATAWFNLQGTISGDQILWGNGTVWTRIS